MKRQEAATVTAIPHAPGDKRAVVKCKNPKCRLNQFRTENGICRKCGWKLPLSVAAWVARSVPRSKSVAMAMQLALGKYLEDNEEEPF